MTVATPKQEQRQSSPWLIALLGIIALLATLAGSIFLAFLTFVSCSGDGGVPYSARDSAYGQMCEWGVINAAAWALLLVPPAAVLVGIISGLTRRRLLDLAIGICVAVGFVGSTLIVFAALPGECSEEQKQNGERCATY